MNNFQTILIAVFLAFFIFGVLIFSGILKLGGDVVNTPQGNVVVWGTLNNPDVYKILDNLNQTNPNLNITYVVKPETTYEQSLIEAFASGTGPDLFIMKSDMINRFEKFVYKTPFANYSERLFRDTFIDGADIYLANDGIIGMPLVVDPMVMYYNKNLFKNEGLSQVPQYWSDLFNLNSKLTKKKDDGTILQSMIALGRFDNITHSKDILATLFIQSGNTIVKRDNSGTTNPYVSTLNDNPSSLVVSPVAAVLNFFVEFSNPSDSAYSWNRSLPNSIDSFTGGKLAMYIGRASELFKIESMNPNLSFDITQVLQTKGVSTKSTYGDIYAVSVNKKSANLTASVGVSNLLTNSDNASSFAKALSLPPVLRSLLAVSPTDLYLSTFFNSAVISKSWIDPNSNSSDIIFNQLIQNILTNNSSVESAINKAKDQFDQILNK